MKITVAPRRLIGKEGDSAAGEGTIPRLWAEANGSFAAGLRWLLFPIERL